MNNVALDILHTRRPTLNYVSPAICDAIFSSTSFPTLVLEAVPKKPGIRGLTASYSAGSYRLRWENYPGALCYTVYRVNDATDPFGEYSIIAECISDPQYEPALWELPFDPDDPKCYLVSVLTSEGEIFADTDPLCFTWSEVEGAPPPDPGGGGFVCEITTASPLEDASFGEEFSAQIETVANDSGFVWSISAGALPAGVSLAPDTGLLSGTPTESGEFTFTIRVSLGDAFCEKEFALTVEASPCAEVFSGAEWSQIGVSEGNGATTSVTAIGASFQSVSTAPEAAAICGDPGTVEVNRQTFKDYEGTVQYVGPAIECCVTLTIAGTPFATQGGVANYNSTCDGYFRIDVMGGDTLMAEFVFNDENNGTFNIPFTIPEAIEPITLVISAGTGASTAAQTDLSCAFPNPTAPQAQMSITAQIGTCSD
jgi:hypothetical protein